MFCSGHTESNFSQNSSCCIGSWRRRIRYPWTSPGARSLIFIVKYGTLCLLPSPLCGEMGGRGLKHCKIQYVWHLDFWRGCPGAQEAQALASCFLISPDASKMPRVGYFPHSGLGRKGVLGSTFSKRVAIHRIGNPENVQK